jgi:hypothetical protein
MAKLTNIEIERGSVVKIDKIILPINPLDPTNINENGYVIYRVVYNTEGYNYTFKLRGESSTIDDLKSRIYNTLIETEKYVGVETRINTVKQRQESITELNGQSIKEPGKDEGDGRTR